MSSCQHIIRSEETFPARGIVESTTTTCWFLICGMSRSTHSKVEKDRVRVSLLGSSLQGNSRERTPVSRLAFLTVRIR